MEFFKGLLIQKIKTIIADIIINQKISALEITPKLEEISSLAKRKSLLNLINSVCQSSTFSLHQLISPMMTLTRLMKSLRIRLNLKLW